MDIDELKRRVAAGSWLDGEAATKALLALTVQVNNLGARMTRAESHLGKLPLPKPPTE